MVSFTSRVSFALLLLLLFATTFNGKIFSTSSLLVRCNENDQRLLSIFKEGVVDPLNRLSSWNTEEDCCLWEGVQCDITTGRVTDLSLSDRGLQGEINLCLLQIQFLKYLNFSYNHFKTVSTSPCQVSQSPTHRFHNRSLATVSTQQENFSATIHYLDFSYNYDLVINDLHWLSQISSLKYLDLSAVDIGSEAKWLQHMGMLPLLSVLRLSGCRLRHFPSLNYVNFTSLVTLDLSDNHINSMLPASFFNVTKDISVLDLGWNNFYGHIPIALFKLPYLKRLSLRYNQLRGSLPDWLDRHEHLQYFDISENLISGPIPSCFGNLSSLVFLDLSRNQLSGNLPISFGQVHNLKYLIIRGNSFMGVLAEKNFANLSRLTYLDLSSTGFKFHFDPNWVPPFQLESLDVSNTSLGPNLPAWLYTQRSLRGLDISTCGIANIDENVFWSIVSRIHSVDLSNNLISGDISNVTLHSSSISLDDNNFTGSLPHISSDVFYVSASNNAFSGSIFPLLCDSNATEVYHLDVSHNHLTGKLPDCWTNWKQLDHLNLGSNKLTGEIPPSMASLNHLQGLNLQNNNFFGKFSLDLSNWTNLVYLFLERNKFSGSLPNLQQKNLVVIQLRANQFTGNIPSQICSLSTVRVLDLADNMLSGPIPYCLYNIMNSYPTDDIYPIEAANLVSKGRELNYNDAFIVNSIDLSSNNLSGEIPKELFRMTQLWSLNLSRNQLTGKISKEIGSMKNLESLDLSFNKLYGKIPSTISNLSFLAYLNLSYNNFNGEIPLGTQIQSFELWSFVGNLELCGDPLPKICHKKEETDNSKLDEENEDDNYTKSLYLGMGIGFAVGFWGVCGSLFFIRSWRHKFFRLFGHLVDQLCVFVTLSFKSFH
ncbi:receptor-like protein EIX2 [Prosopis cineraria]|uniref:receptor-like protein EIX2 n=1 Tax=Prosopis cineraria TaxID=364024 RepID=UPI00240FCDBB|nr:receptor-like protein EIX2 [Prosopis cineraria]XP_054819957.1 receptor-like protein EIX2 [Prosopis cineraria]